MYKHFWPVRYWIWNLHWIQRMLKCESSWLQESKFQLETCDDSAHLIWILFPIPGLASAGLSLPKCSAHVRTIAVVRTLCRTFRCRVLLHCATQRHIVMNQEGILVDIREERTWLAHILIAILLNYCSISVVTLTLNSLLCNLRHNYAE